MQYNQQRQFDALTRSEAVLDANVDVIGALATSAGRQQLHNAVTALSALTNEQGSANLFMLGHRTRERAISAELVTQHMRPIAHFARVKLRGVPDIAAIGRSTKRLTGHKLVNAARAMATAAAPHRDALTQGGFPPDAIDQLGASADALLRALTDHANMKVARVGSTKGIEEQLKLGREAVEMLHAVISRQYAGDEAFLARWNAARRVTSKPGLARGAAAKKLVEAKATDVQPVQAAA
ncbi:MAG: hypothetical protein JWM95_1553 [Gemmatimonadetes bacterium]|nr:hypothetical protein [Gemmatimonadota bacterium]